MSKRRRSKIQGQFHARTIEMMESPAYRVLSLSAHRVLDRICVEYAHHGGTENGRPPVTFDDFVDYGIHRHAVAPAIRELEVLGFIEITQRGKPSAGTFRWPNYFRLTFVNPEPTNEWKAIKTMEEAKMRADMARSARTRPRRSPVSLMAAAS
jgi:hypothetical protein